MMRFEVRCSLPRGEWMMWRRRWGIWMGWSWRLDCWFDICVWVWVLMGVGRVEKCAGRVVYAWGCQLSVGHVTCEMKRQKWIDVVNYGMSSKDLWWIGRVDSPISVVACRGCDVIRHRMLGSPKSRTIRLLRLNRVGDNIPSINNYFNTKISNRQTKL